MPLYEFLCNECQTEQEHLIRPGEIPPCESCGSERMVRLLSAPAAHVAGQSTSGPQGGGPCGGGCACHPH